MASFDAASDIYQALARGRLPPDQTAAHAERVRVLEQKRKDLAGGLLRPTIRLTSNLLLLLLRMPV
jgi:hypothetical protein